MRKGKIKDSASTRCQRFEIAEETLTPVENVWRHVQLK
jgi:hypothetical protein